MLRCLLTMTAAAVLFGGLLFSPLRADESNNAIATARASGAPETQTEVLNPFSHSAQVPVQADLNSIRFEKLKMVKVATQVNYTGCDGLGFGEPPASVDCPHVQTGEFIAAYETTYSYKGEPLASDETANRDFSFSVYFRADELPQDVRRALSDKKLSRADLAGYFSVNTHRDLVRRTVIDPTQSHFCAGTYVDGAWTDANAGCQDVVSFTTTEVPSDLITVNVELVGAHQERAAK